MCKSVVNHGRRHHADPGVAETAEAVGKLGPVFHGAEPAFGVRVVVGGVRPAVGFGHAEVGQQESRRFGPHGRTAVGVKSRAAGLNVRLPAAR